MLNIGYVPRREYFGRRASKRAIHHNAVGHGHASRAGKLHVRIDADGDYREVAFNLSVVGDHPPDAAVAGKSPRMLIRAQLHTRFLMQVP